MRSRHGGARPGQEARAHAVGDLAEPQVEARRLDLVGDEIAAGRIAPLLGQRRDHVIGQDAFLVGGKGQRH